MKDIFDFFINTQKLKDMPRRGWVINQIKNPESVAEHVFRATIMGWFLGEKKGYNIEEIMKMALAHDLCEIYAGDTTPYDSILPKNKEELKKLMKTWPRFSFKEKKRNAEEKYEKEKQALLKLISKLSLDLKEELRNLWLDYEKKISLEGRFFNQADRMENFLQAYEYWEEYKNPPHEPWWIWAREFFDDPLLLEFLEVSEFRFHKREIPQELKSSYKLFDFFGRVGTLKRKRRKIWAIHQIENAETTADHIYQHALLSWILARDRKDLDLEKVIKIALIHDLPEVYAPDLTPYDAASLSEEKRAEEINLKDISPIKSSPSNRQRKLMNEIKIKEEEKGMRKLIKNLEKEKRKEIYTLKEEFDEEKTPEGKFVNETNMVVNFFQGMEYYKKYGDIDYKMWIKRVEEKITEPILIEFVKEVKNHL